MRVALVTGGTRGIGFAIAARLASERFDLAICGLRDSKEVAETLRALEAHGVTVIYVQADIASRADRDRLVATVRDGLGRLDVLVNNAAMAPRRRADILDASEESFEEVMRANLQGPYFLTQACAHWMVEQHMADPKWSGCIVNISSMSATVASVDRGEYCLSKAALSMATKLWAARLGEFAIPVYEVRPGIIKTAMTAPVEAKYDGLIKGGIAVQRRWGTPDDVGRAVAALVRGELPYSTGNVVHIDGGLTVPRL